METKTAKILSVQENQRQFDYQGATFFEHHIKFEGSDLLGVYASKSDKCDKFKVGETTTFELELKQYNGSQYYKIKPMRQNNGYTGGNNGGPKDQGTITALSCIGSACIAVQQSANSTNSEMILKMADEFFRFATSKSTLNK